MARLTIAFGAVLILTGVISYFATGRESVTALIPAFFGAPVLLAGLVSLLQPRWRSYGLLATAGLVLLLALGTFRGVFGLLAGEVSPASVINAVLLAVSIAFLALCVQELRGRTRGHD